MEQIIVKIFVAEEDSANLAKLMEDFPNSSIRFIESEEDRIATDFLIFREKLVNRLLNFIKFFGSIIF